MKLKLKKTHLKNLSLDANVLPAEMTPQVAGGTRITVVVMTVLSVIAETMDARYHDQKKGDYNDGGGREPTGTL